MGYIFFTTGPSGLCGVYFDLQSALNVTKCPQGPQASLTQTALLPHEPSETEAFVLSPGPPRQGAISLQYLGEVLANVQRIAGSRFTFEFKASVT